MSVFEDIAQEHGGKLSVLILVSLYVAARWLFGRWVKSQDAFQVDIEARMRLLESERATRATQGDVTALWERLNTVSDDVRADIAAARQESNQQLDRMIIALRNGRRP